MSSTSAPQRRTPILIASLVATFLVAMEYNVVATASTTIVASLGGMELFTWVFASYVATATIATPIYGKLADLYGRKRVLMASALLFLLGSALCALADTMPQLILYRAVQGIGGGGIVPLVLTIFGDMFSVEERARYQGILGSVWGFSALIGPALGAFIVTAMGWPWLFWINLPVGGVALLMLWLFLHEAKPAQRPRLDWPGALLLAAAVGALMFGTALISTGWGWTDPLVLSLLLASGAAGALFLWQQRRAPEPLLPLSLFAVPLIAVSGLANVFFGVVLFTALANVPVLASQVQQANAQGTAVVIAALSLGWPAASAIAARLLITMGYRAMAVLGQSLQVATVLLLRAAGPATPLWQMVALMVLLGAGFGFANPAYLIGVQNAVPWQRRGVATASLQFVRALGQTIGGAILGSIFAAGMSQLARSGGLTPAGVDRVLDQVFLLAAAAGALAVVIALAMPSLRPGQEQGGQPAPAPGH